MGEFSVWHWIIVLLLFVPVWGVLALFCSSLSKTLAVVDPPLREQSPGSAWLLLIPLFSTIWMFFAVIAVRRGFERMTAAGRLSQPSDGAGSLGIALAVIGLLNFIPYLNLLTGLVGLVLFIIYWNRLVDLRRLVIPNGGTTSAAAPLAAGMASSREALPSAIAAEPPRAMQSQLRAPPPHRPAPAAIQATAEVPQAAPEAALPARPTDVSATDRAADMSGSATDDALFDQVAEELESGNRVRATWTRAFAEAGGDDNQARVIYIRLRVSRLKEERAEHERQAHESALAQAERTALRRLERTVLGPIEEARLANDTPDAARFRASVRVGALADARDLLARYPHFVHLRAAGAISMLQLAAHERLPDMARLLIEHGARDWPGPSGSAMAHAIEHKDARMVEVLKAAAPAAGESYDAAQAAARGPYRGREIFVLAGGPVQVEGDSRSFDSVDEAANAIDAGLAKARPPA